MALASTAFLPPLIEPSRPDIDLIRRTVAGDIAHSQSLDAEAARQASATATPGEGETAAPAGTPQPAPSTAAPSAPATPTPSAGSSGTPSPDKPVVGKKAEKSRNEFSTQRQTDDLTQVCGVS